MPRRSILTERQRSALFDLPTDEATLLHHYILADDDIEHIRTRREARTRRFLMHVLPDRFHHIRHYGFLAGAGRKDSLAKVRALLGDIKTAQPDQPEEAPPPLTLREPCPCCGGPMRIIETFRRGQIPRTRAPPRKQAA